MCTQDPVPVPMTVTHVGADDVPGLISSGAVLIDVREHHETAMGCVPGATLMPMRTFNLDDVPTDRPLVFICRSGSRSEAVAMALAGMGYATYNVLGGMVDWQAAGYPMVAEDGSPGTVL